MESISFLLISLGAILALFFQLLASKGQVSILNLLIVTTIIIVSLSSWLGVFIGPIGDAKRYHQTINQCLGHIPPCGTKVHELLWSYFSSLIGEGWAVFYGYLITISLYSVVKDIETTWRNPILAILVLYAAYQVGNGMAEGTYFLLLFCGVALFRTNHTILGSFALFTSFAAHLGNIPFLLFILRFWKRYVVFSLLLILLVILCMLYISVDLEKLLSLVGKGGLLSSEEKFYLAIESKMRVSIRDAETSYAHILSNLGFPYSIFGTLTAVLLYMFPLISGGGGLQIIVSGLSSLMTLKTFFLVKSSSFLLIVAILSTVIFALGSYTPGIGLRHKVPLFLFILVCMKKYR